MKRDILEQRKKKNTTEFYFLFDFNKALLFVVFFIFRCKVQNAVEKE